LYSLYRISFCFVLTQTNDTIICHYGKDPVEPPVVTGMSDKLLEIMIGHHNRILSLKWQYYGNEQGTLYTYPAVATCGPDYEDYDPRIRHVLSSFRPITAKTAYT